MLILSTNWVITLYIAFMVLILLIVLSIIIGKTADNKKAEKATKQNPKEVISEAGSAAIAMALYLYYRDTHDKESDVITIKNTHNRYSPWNSKIYGIQ